MPHYIFSAMQAIQMLHFRQLAFFFHNSLTSSNLFPFAVFNFLRLSSLFPFFQDRGVKEDELQSILNYLLTIHEVHKGALLFQNSNYGSN